MISKVFYKLKKNKAIFYLSIFAILLKIPPVFFQELPPYTFCDEDIFLLDSFNMFYSNSWIIGSNFLSGGFNIYIPLIANNIYSIFFGYPNIKDFVIISRFVSVLIFYILGVIYLYKTVFLIFNSRIAFTLTLLYILSPVALALSRIHYPDHYILSFIFIAMYYSIDTKLWNFSIMIRKSIILGLIFGILISIKYNIILIFPFLLFFVVFLNSMIAFKENLKDILKALFLFTLSFLLASMLFNFSGLINFQEFLNSWNSNYQNYRMDNPLPLSLAWENGISFYIKVVFLQFFGFLSIFFYLLGNYHLIKYKKKIFFVLNLPIFFAIIFLGRYHLYINRNMLMVLPFYLLIIGFGIQYLDRILAKNNLKLLIVLLLFIEPLLRSGIIIIDDFKIDSRIQMERYITNNLSKEVNIGHLWSCWDKIPIPKNRRKQLNISELSKDYSQVDYFLVDTWWTRSQLPQSFLRVNEDYPSFFGFSNYRNFHFTHFSGGPKDKVLPNIDFHNHFLEIFRVGNSPELILYKRKVSIESNSIRSR